MTSLPIDKKPFLGRIVLQLLGSYPNLKNSYQSSFPDLYADLESASTNPNCSCRGKVLAHIQNNLEQSTTLFNSFLQSHSDDEKVLGVINTDWVALMPKPYAGKMFEIDNTPVAYKTFIDTIQQDRAAYRLMSTAIQDTKLFIYFA